MDVVGVMAAYLPVVRVCTAQSREALCVYCVCTAQSREALSRLCRVSDHKIPCDPKHVGAILNIL